MAMTRSCVRVVRRRATIIVTTPEKWDGVTRGWKSRDYVKDTGLVVGYTMKTPFWSVGC